MMKIVQKYSIPQAVQRWRSISWTCSRSTHTV